MGVVIIKITSKRPNSYLATTFQQGGPHAVAQRLADFISSLHTGTESAAGPGQPPSINVTVQGNATSASATVSFSGVGAVGDTVIVNGVTFTGAAAAAANVYAIGATATTTAAGLAAAINASVSPFVQNNVIASSALGVTTVTSAFSGVAGNQTTLAKGTDTGGVMTVSSAKLLGGIADPAAVTLNF